MYATVQMVYWLSSGIYQAERPGRLPGFFLLLNFFHYKLMLTILIVKKDTKLDNKAGAKMSVSHLCNTYSSFYLGCD